MPAKPETTYLNNVVYKALDSLGEDCQYAKTHGNQYSRRGMPDVVGTFRGMPFVIEGKVGDNTTSLKQDHELGKWEKAGALALVIHEDEFPRPVDVVMALQIAYNNFLEWIRN